MTVKYLEEPRRGQSYSRNTGLANAGGDIIIFTDDDLTFPTNWVVNLIEPILADRADAVAGIARMAPDLERSWMTYYHKVYYAQILEDQGDLLTFVGANMAFHRRVLEAVPEFDVSLGPGALGFCDDLLFGAMIKAAGFRLVFNPNAEITHHFDASRLTREALLKHAEQLGRSCGYTAYHWQHQEISAPFLRRLRKAMQIAIRRARNANHSPTEEGCDEAELFDINGWAYVDQYIKEQANPPKYQRPDLDRPKRNPVTALISDIMNRVPSKS